MGKHIARPVTVRLDKRNRPVAFEWRENVYHVKDVQECWRLTGAWWDGEAEKTFFRLRTDKNGIYELRFDHGKENWAITRSED
jgi:hypothetical protein